MLEEKKASIESHIMRHLKGFKKRSLQELSDHISQLMHLELQVASSHAQDRDLRKILTGLINTDYIRRDEQNPQIFHYIP